MPIESMTGFARQDAVAPNGHRLSCEIRSVNGKSLDVRLRLPTGMDRLELPLRQHVQSLVTRGNLQISVSIEANESIEQLAINERLIENLLALSERLEAKHGLNKPTIGELLSIRGVMESSSAATYDELDAPIMKIVHASVLALKQSRANEGQSLKAILLSQLAQIEALVGAALADPSRTLEIIRERLGLQVKLLMESVQGFDEQRLTMEAALLATKADIREELDRLSGHIIAARSLLKSDGPVGRKLDFLAQEFNRETNTVCSKSNALTITTIGLELKAVVDQFREQVQNLE